MYANSLVRRWLSVVTVVVLVGWTGMTLAQGGKSDPPKPKDVVDVAKEASEMQTFCKLLESAGLVETLKEKGPVHGTGSLGGGVQEAGARIWMSFRSRRTRPNFSVCLRTMYWKAARAWRN